MKYKKKLKANDDFASDLERLCAKLLNNHSIRYNYEPKSLEVSSPFKFKTLQRVGKGKNRKFKETETVRKITYTPDFMDVNNRWIIETKGYRTPAFTVRLKIIQKYCSEHNIKLYIPETESDILVCINDIKQNFN
jgi:hypothetical protein